MEAHQAAIVEIPEQSDRTGSSGYQVPNQAHARLQKLRLRRHHNCRRRTAPPYSQRSICPASSTSQRPSCACDLECGPCCINHCLSSASSCIPQYLHQSLRKPGMISPERRNPKSQLLAAVLWSATSITLIAFRKDQPQNQDLINAIVVN